MNREARARAKRKRDSAQPQEIGRSLKRSPSEDGVDLIGTTPPRCARHPS